MGVKRARKRNGSDTRPDRSHAFAVAVVTRRPHRFDLWLEYYRSLGAVHLFVAVEDSPDVLALCKEDPEYVSVAHAQTESNPYDSIIARQEAHVNWALEQCEAMRIGWLFHVDDDELLHLAKPWELILAEVPSSAACLVVRNVEAIPDHSSSDFSSISRFMTDEFSMLAYVNGKAAGRVGATVASGCHRFLGGEWHVPIEYAVVLHFESCPYSRWRDKFLHYASLQRRFSSIPFLFYLNSIKVCTTRTGDESALRSFWRRHKRFHYSGRSGIVTIRHLGLAAHGAARATTRGRAGMAAAG
mmetsp:Transcript_34551/g.72706  ORF Transcript_34551/g.72706 Transcript_34551/m.72706 type:complete len:300 (-) Transcript_34551:500-1399(-)